MSSQNETHDKKIPASETSRVSSQKSLGDMPSVVVEEMVKLLSPYEHSRLRRVFKNFREVIDKMDPGCHRLEFHCYNNRIIITTNNGPYVTHESTEKGCEITVSHHWFYKKTKLDGENYAAIAVLHFEHYLKNPKLKLDQIHISTSSGSTPIQLDEFVTSLRSSGRYLKVKKFAMQSNSELENTVALLSVLCPRTVEFVELSGAPSDFPDFQLMMKLDQIKQAQKVTFHSLNLTIFKRDSSSAVFRKFELIEKDAEKFCPMLENLFMENPCLKSVSMEWEMSKMKARNISGLFSYESTSESDEDPVLLKFIKPIPNSTDTLNFIIDNSTIRINKKC